MGFNSFYELDTRIFPTLAIVCKRIVLRRAERSSLLMLSVKPLFVCDGKPQIRKKLTEIL